MAVGLVCLLHAVLNFFLDAIGGVKAREVRQSSQIGPNRGFITVQPSYKLSLSLSQAQIIFNCPHNEFQQEQRCVLVGRMVGEEEEVEKEEEEVVVVCCDGGQY